jgi:hypothetical protein
MRRARLPLEARGVAFVVLVSNGVRARAIARRTPKQKPFYRNIVQEALCTINIIQNYKTLLYYYCRSRALLNPSLCTK